MKNAVDAQLWLDSHFILPCFDIEAQLEGTAQWHPSSLEWIRGEDWFASDHAVDKIRIYYDGSFLKDKGTIGYAAAAFVQTQGRLAYLPEPSQVKVTVPMSQHHTVQSFELHFWPLNFCMIWSKSSMKSSEPNQGVSLCTTPSL